MTTSPSPRRKRISSAQIHVIAYWTTTALPEPLLVLGLIVLVQLASRSTIGELG